jgi:hypothetical protein
LPSSIEVFTPSQKKYFSAVWPPCKSKHKLNGTSSRTLARKRVKQQFRDPAALYVRQLAKREGIVFVPTFADIWATAVTKMAGDEVKSDSTDDLLVALTRAGKLTPRDMTKLVIAHHRSLASV